MKWTDIPENIELQALSLARSVVGQTGPASQASDVGTLRVAFARANAELLQSGWCNCQKGANEVFWQRDNGSHGWMCTLCYRITQTG